MIVAVADTHTIIWYLFNDPRLSNTARQTIETATKVLAISRYRKIELSSIQTIW